MAEKVLDIGITSPLGRTIGKSTEQNPSHLNLTFFIWKEYGFGKPHLADFCLHVIGQSLDHLTTLGQSASCFLKRNYDLIFSGETGLTFSTWALLTF